ncbi:MAG: hypothetical protein SPI30_04245 [Prevotella sp.]|nr:hypothetical protein [Prevotella sp.]
MPYSSLMVLLTDCFHSFVSILPAFGCLPASYRRYFQANCAVSDALLCDKPSLPVIVPVTGTVCTNAWYGSYQCLVHVVPVIGSFSGIRPSRLHCRLFALLPACFRLLVLFFMRDGKGREGNCPSVTSKMILHR